MAPTHAAVHLRLATLLVWVVVGLAACGQPQEPAAHKMPDSPVGHFGKQLYRYAGRLTNPDGSSSPDRLTATHDLTLDVRPDHTFRYEWKSLTEPGAGDGSLEGSWRDDPEHGSWVFEESGGVGAGRSVSFVEGEVVRPGETPSGRTLVPGQWAFPIPDTATGRLTDNYMFILRPAK